MRRLALAIAFACVLSSVASAGEIASTGIVAEIPATGGAAPAAGIHSRGETTVEEIPGTGVTTSEASNTALTIILTLISIV